MSENIASLIIAGFEAMGLEYQMIDGNHVFTKKKKVPRGTKTVEYSEDFEKAWNLYPRRAGQNNKVEAYSRWCQRLKEGENLSVLIGGVERYAKFIRETDKEGTEYVKMASTFFGKNKHYLADWDGPEKKLNKAEKDAKRQKLKQEPWAKVPPISEWDEIVKFVKKYGYKTPNKPITNVEDAREYVRRLYNEIDEIIERKL